MSKNTYLARKSNDQLKTQIRLGEENLVLLVKMKGEKDWEVEPELDKMGNLPEPEWFKNWPNLEVPDITSPPKGRSYSIKNVHSLSSELET